MNEGLSLEHIQELREAIIKTILVIFTSKENQHLLLNDNIIEVAINCIQNSQHLSDMASVRLANLLSIIFQFPQVQCFLTTEVDVYEGFIRMLKYKHPSDVYISSLVKACASISLNSGVKSHSHSS